ncbi:MAG: carbamoyltransferase [Candidatus Latescibacterota bacterium]
MIQRGPLLANILGISCFYHDSAAALITDGKIIAAAQEERFSRRKHDPRFPVRAVNYCLEEAGLRIDDIDHIVYYDNIFLSFDRLLGTFLSIAPKGLRPWTRYLPRFIKQKFEIFKIFHNEIGWDKDIHFCEHHLSHAASSFYPSPFENAAILTIDGVGEWATASYGIGTGNKLEILSELRYPNSLGMLYTAFTSFCGFKANSGEYKLMGLAPYGEPKYKDIIFDKIIDAREDGSLALNLEYFGFLDSTEMSTARFAALFGGPKRLAETKISKREMDIAASIQAVTQEIMLKIAAHVKKETGMKHLCLAGGVALNCVANGHILRQSGYDDIWIQPAAGDAGGALGSALAYHYLKLGGERHTGNKLYSQEGSLFGPSFSQTEIETFLKDTGAPYHVFANEDRAKVTAELLSEGKIIGHFAGRMEFGPRALGSRSILGDSRNKEMQKTLNLKIKFRESFRPFAPVVLEENVSDYFELDRPSPYMLLVAPVRKERCIEVPDPQDDKDILEWVNEIRSDIPAITHVDYSARVQSIRGDHHGKYYDLIKQFRDITGYGVIVNTSFNVRGEPIVCTPSDAYQCFMRTNMDVLVLEDCILYKEEQPAWHEEKDWRDEYELD